MLRLTQQDSRWGELKINDSQSKMKYHGCLITSLCMIFSRFHPLESYLPNEAVSDWKFKGDLLDWNTKFKGMEFIKRVWDFDPKEVSQYVKNNYGVVVQVLTKSGTHWLAVWGWGYLGKPVCFDPWDKTVLYNPWGFGGKYVRPIGWAVMARI